MFKRFVIPKQRLSFKYTSECDLKLGSHLPKKVFFICQGIIQEFNLGVGSHVNITL